MGGEGGKSPRHSTPKVRVNPLQSGSLYLNVKCRSDRFTVDLHGLTVNEAIIVAADTVHEWWNSAPTGKYSCVLSPLSMAKV